MHKSRLYVNQEPRVSLEILFYPLSKMLTHFVEAFV